MLFEVAWGSCAYMTPDSLSNLAHDLARDWYTRCVRDQHILAFRVHALLLAVHEDATAQERERICAKLAKLVAV